MRRKKTGLARAIPAILAVVGLAVPMIGSGFIGWPFAAGWLVLLLLLWSIRPLDGAHRRPDSEAASRRSSGSHSSAP